MADDIAEIQGSLNEIKAALANKKKSEGQEITTDVFTDPRFIELFENYFKPLIDSSKVYKERLTEKKKLSVFDVIGVSDRIQEQKRNALTKEIEKITEKLSKIGKNLGNVRHYTISDILGLTKTERTTNRRIVNNAIRTLSLNINKTAKNLGDTNLVMKFIGLKPMKIETPKIAAKKAAHEPSVTEPFVEKPVEIREKKGKKKVVATVPPPVTSVPSTSAIPAVSTPAPVIAPTPTPGVSPSTESLAEKEKSSMKVTRVAIVDLSESVKDFFKHHLGGVPSVDKGKGTGEDRESYSHSMNALARLLTLGAGLLTTGIAALVSGLFDTGPLKGVKKIIASYSLQLAAGLGKSALHYLSNLMPKTAAWVKEAFSTGLGAVKKVFSKAFGETLIKAGEKAGMHGLMARASLKLVKWLGEAFKKIPIIGALISVGFAMNRFANGDIIGGLIDLGSGVASTIPIVGTAVSIALDIWNATRDIKSGGVKQNASRGWNKKINEFLQKTFKKLLYGAVITLPFGDQIAKMLGITSGELAAGLSDEPEPNKAVSPELEKSKNAISNANKVRQKAENRKQQLLNGRQITDLTPQERSEYNEQDVIIGRANASIEKSEASVRGAQIKKETPTATAIPAPKAPTTAEQKPTAGYEEDAELQREQDTADEALKQPEVEVQPNPPITPPAQHIQKSDETLDTLRKMNDNLEEMNLKTSRQGQSQQPAANSTNVITAVGGGGNGNGSAPLLIALETIRDTAYVAREKARNMIIDYRAIA